MQDNIIGTLLGIEEVDNTTNRKRNEKRRIDEEELDEFENSDVLAQSDDERNDTDRDDERSTSDSDSNVEL